MSATSEADPTDIPDAENFASYRQLLRYSVPLILSCSSGMLMQFVDRLFLAWHAPASIAGAGTAGMLAVCFSGFFAGITGYTGVFVSQYLGAGRPTRAGPAVWQGIHLALVCGALLMAGAPLSATLFEWLGHADAVRRAEIDYFRVISLGGPLFLLPPALGGFFIGRGDNRTVLAVQAGGAAVNVALDYVLIFGRAGFPAWGVAGAAWATVAAQAAITLTFLALFWRRRHGSAYGTRTGWRPEPALARRLLRYGMPAGLRNTAELLFWSMFLVLVGRVGADELAVTNVAFAINNLSWQPALGVGMAVMMLVARAQGAGRPDLARRAMRRGLLLSQLWMLAAAAVFVLAPHFLLTPFFGFAAAGGEPLSPEQSARLIDLGTALLRFVAVYCLLDGFNVIFNAALQGAGDTWWLFKATAGACLAAGLAMAAMDRAGAGLYAYWTLATTYILATAVIWYWRYRGGAWESMRVIEPTVIAP